MFLLKRVILDRKWRRLWKLVSVFTNKCLKLWSNFSDKRICRNWLGMPELAETFYSVKVQVQMLLTQIKLWKPGTLSKSALKILTSGEGRMRQLYKKHNLYVQQRPPRTVISSLNKIGCRRTRVVGRLRPSRPGSAYCSKWESLGLEFERRLGTTL